MRTITKANYPHLLGTHNQLANCHNRYQGRTPKVLFLCSAGLLRSATAAHIFSSEPYNWNTRTAGVAIEYALNPVNEALLEWADEVYVMENEHLVSLASIFGDSFIDEYQNKVTVLNVPDSFAYRDPELVKFLKEEVAKHSKFLKEETTDGN